MRVDLHIDRLLIRGADPVAAREALARLPDLLKNLSTGTAGGRRLHALRVAAGAADPDTLARALTTALTEALAGHEAAMPPTSPTRHAGGTTEALPTTQGG
ncbi:MAG: hypothetical protein MUC79_04015 [Thiobacillaceae bacterium]|jgi:hypothetical protein|nr:hypothetical protein [Thiobacillaceae bacterium]